MSSSVLETEILQQPGVVQALLDAETDSVQKMVMELKKNFNYVIIAARGTSDNAARYAQYLFGAHNQLPVALATPSLYTLYQQPPDMRNALVIGISQSGQSPDIVSVLTEANRQGRPTLAITNDEQSPLAAEARFVIPLHAGPEKAVAATKTYTTSLAALALFSSCLREDNEKLDELRQAPACMQTTLAGLSEARGHVERYRYINRCAVLGRGFNYASAFEVALKIKELTRVVAEPYSSADFRHGPIALVQNGFPVILVVPQGAVKDDLLDLIQAIKKRDSEMLIISDSNELLDQAHLALPVTPGLPEWLSPLVTVLPGQIFGMQLTIEKGMDPDHPAGLTKVTETL